MASAREDLVQLSDHAWRRFRDRMAGVSPPEWAWTPVADARISLRWRLGHLAYLLGDSRNGPWLGLGPEPGARPHSPDSVTAHDRPAAALDDLDAAYRQWRGQLDRTTDASLAAPIGSLAGPYGGATRYSFALHVVDELIHHAAEGALLRDLYAGRTAPSAGF